MGYREKSVLRCAKAEGAMDYVEKYGRWALVLGGSEGLGRAMAESSPGAA